MGRSGWAEVTLNQQKEADAGILCGAVFLLNCFFQNFVTCAHDASSRRTSKNCGSQPESGATENSGRVAEKCGEVRRKLTLRKSQSRDATSALIIAVISRCQSLRVVNTNGPH